MKRQLPFHGWCFVYGKDNPQNIWLAWLVGGNGIRPSEFTLNERQQGPPGHIHGGASAAILDKAMGSVVWVAGHKVTAVSLERNSYKPLPLNQPLSLEGRITQIDGRKFFSTGETLLTDSTTADSGRGIFVVAPSLFEHVQL